MTVRGGNGYREMTPNSLEQIYLNDSNFIGRLTGLFARPND